MFENSREDIHIRNKIDDYTMISFFSSKLNVLIIGAGKAALIKAKTFLRKGCNVKVVAKQINEEFYNFPCEKISIIKEEYNKNYLKGNHIIVIAIDDSEIIDNIILDCEDLDKIYINCNNSKNGIGIVPMNIRSDEIFVGINTLRGNPKASRMVGNYILDEIKDFDNFIKVTSIIRNNLNKVSYKKNEILEFIISDDFKYIINKGKEKLILELFYDEELVNKLFE